MNQLLFDRNERIRRRHQEILVHAERTGEKLTSDKAMEMVAVEENMSKEAVKQILYRPSSAEMRFKERMYAT